MIAEHSQFRDKKYDWKIMDMCLKGLTELQRNYLMHSPAPAGFFDEELKEQYKGLLSQKRNYLALPTDYTDALCAYITGGRVNDLCPKTLAGYLGLYTQHAAVIELPSKMDYLKEAATIDGKGIEEAAIQCLKEVLTKGNVHLLITIDVENNRPVLVIYPNESRINWLTDNPAHTDDLYKQVVFVDYDEIDDIFESSVATKMLIDHRLENDIYTVVKRNESGEIIGTAVQPKIQGKTLGKIPVVSIGSVDNTPEINNAPLEPIANITTSILCMDTELSHFGMLATAPTLVISGVQEDEAPSVVGAGVAILLPNYTSKAYYTKVDSSALEHIRQRIADAYSEAQEYGASLLGSNKNMSESGEALRLRQAATTVTLRSVVNNVGKGIQVALDIMAEWMGIQDEVRFEPNTEFSTFTMTANEQVALVQSWQAGAISHSTMLYNFKKANMLSPGATVEDEKELLKKVGEKFQSEEGLKEPPPIDIGEDATKGGNPNPAIEKQGE